MDKNLFPNELLALKHWICWRLEPDPNGGKDKKVPYSPFTGKKAYVNKHYTWATYDEAIKVMEKYGYNGIGFVFTTEIGIIAIDIDDCFINGELNETGKEILAKAPKTFIEKSPSGKGLHILVRGKLPGGGRRNKDLGVEIYATSRYFTMSGDLWNDCADTIAEDNGIVDYVYKLACSRQKEVTKQTDEQITSSVGLTDDELLKLANASKDGADFGKLYHGEWHGVFKSQSEADFALCCKLAFWSGRNFEQIDRIFRTSALIRDKWDTAHYADGTTYGSKTINNACAITKKTYKPSKKKRVKSFTPDTNYIFEQCGCYFRNKDDAIYQITNFIIEPIEMLVYDDGAQISCYFITQKGEKFKMHLEAPSMADLRSFKNAIGKKTFALTFYGGTGDLDHFKTYIYDKLEWVKKRGAKALGIYPRNKGESLVFVNTDGAVGVGGIADNSIVQLESYKVTESDILSVQMINKDELLALGKHLMTYNEPAKTVPILAWTAGCFIKPHLRKINVKFPHLFLVGERGGGKSNSLERIIYPMVGQNHIYAASQVTGFTLLKESNSSNIIPTLLEEFKPCKIKPSQLHMLYNYFRDSYDCHKGIRGKPDQTVLFYDLLAPIAVAGEESADESAIRERSIELLFSKLDLKKDAAHQISFDWICENELLIRSFGRSILDTALQTNKHDVALWCNEGKEFFSANLPSRIRSNLCAMYAGICLIGRLCSLLGVSFTDVFPFGNEECAKYLEASVREYLLDDSSFNKGIIETTFEIMSRMKMKLGEDYCLENNNQYITIALSDVYDKYTRYLKDFAIKGESLEYKQFCKQLRKTEYCVKGSYKKRMAKESKWVWTLNFQKLSANCDVVNFIRETAEDSGS